MRELKVQCDCGQKFKFDVEPVNNQMPFAVNCPICGKDGTEKANILLRAQAGLSAAPVAGVPIPSAHAAPMRIAMPAAPAPMTASVHPAPATAPPSLVPTAPHPSEQPRLRIGTTAPAAAEGDVPLPPPPIAPPAPFRPMGAQTAPAAQSDKKSSFAMGLLGGLIGVVVGSIAYYFLLRYTDYFVFKLAALGVGALAGWLAEVMGKGDGSKELGIITATLTIAGVIGAQYLAAYHFWHLDDSNDVVASYYQDQMKEAKKVMAAVPTGSEQEIRAYLVKMAAGDGEKISADAVGTNDIAEFRDKELPEYRELVAGHITKEQLAQKHGIEPPTQEEKTIMEGTFNAFFVILLLRKYNIASYLGAGALAYKLSTNA